jgi:hypothetical protein
VPKSKILIPCNMENSEIEKLLNAVGKNHPSYLAVQDALYLMKNDSLKPQIGITGPMPPQRTAEIYAFRFENLKRKKIPTGGFQETLDALNTWIGPVRALTWFTPSCKIICFVDSDLQRFIGCVYLKDESKLIDEKC